MSKTQVDLFLDQLVDAPIKDERALMEFPFFSLRKQPRMTPFVYNDGTVKIGKLNVDENPESAGGFGISSIPAVLLFKDGKVVETLVGVQPKERYEAAIHKTVASASV